MWLHMEMEEVIRDGLEQFEPDTAGGTAVPGPSTDGETQWILWAEARGEAEGAVYELGFLATG